MPALLEFARGHGVTHILVGRTHQPWWKQRLGLTFVHRMLQESDDFDLHVVSLLLPPGRAPFDELLAGHVRPERPAHVLPIDEHGCH